MIPHGCVLCAPSMPSDTWIRSLPPDHKRAKYLRRIHLGGNTTFQVSELASVAGGRLPNESLDLMELVAAIFLADQMIPRSGQAFSERRIALHIRLRQPELFNTTKEIIEKILFFLTRDVWDVTFYPRKPNAEWERHCSGDSSKKISAVDSVALFSGGMDSFAGAVRLSKQKSSPALLSHSGHWKSQQKRVYKGVEPVTGQPLLQFNVAPRNVGLPAHLRIERKETSQRVRALLFICAAAALANGLGLNKVYICENGVLACAVPPLSSFIPTRHAHPHFIGLLMEALSKLFSRRVEIENPFLLMTKGEALKDISDVIRSNSLEGLISETVSCWQYFSRLLNKKPPNLACGACVPCLVRRAAVKKAGFEANDAKYWVDLAWQPGALQLGLEGGAASEGEDRIRQAWLAYHRFAKEMENIKVSSPSAFFSRPEASELARRPGLRDVSPDWQSQVINLYKRFGQEFTERFPWPKSIQLG